MKQLTWQLGTHKFKPCTIGYINSIKVAAIHENSVTKKGFNAICLLPGLPKAGNNFHTFEGARKAMEDRVELWFGAVQQ